MFNIHLQLLRKAVKHVRKKNGSNRSFLYVMDQDFNLGSVTYCVTFKLLNLSHFLVCKWENIMVPTSQNGSED